MAIEIERKFLVKKDVWKDIYKPKPSNLKQAYILEEDQKVVRIRIKGKNAFLTIKNNEILKEKDKIFDFERTRIKERPWIFK